MGLLARLFPALGVPAFRTFWIGTMPAILAVQMGIVAIGYVAFVLSGSATTLGGISLATGIPMAALSLVGGVVADRARRRTVLIVTQATLGVAALATAGFALTGTLAVWHLYVLALVQGTAFAFNMPARQAYIAELVGPAQLRSAITLNSTSMSFTRIAGPSLAGVLLATPAIGVAGVFASMAAMYGAVLGALFRLPERRSGPVSARGGWDQLVEGLHHIRSSPTLLVLLTLGFAPMLLGMPFQSLLPLFAERVYGVGALGLGVMTAAVGVGSLGGAFVVTLLPRAVRLGHAQIGLGVAFGLALVGFALAPTYPAAVVMLGLTGLTSAGYGTVNQTMVMEHADPEFHGRVVSIYLLAFGLMPLATMPEAWLADHLGGPATIAGAGVLVIIVVLLVVLFVPSYRQAR